MFPFLSKCQLLAQHLLSLFTDPTHFSLANSTLNPKAPLRPKHKHQHPKGPPVGRIVMIMRRIDHFWSHVVRSTGLMTNTRSQASKVRHAASKNLEKSMYKCKSRHLRVRLADNKTCKAHVTDFAITSGIQHDVPKFGCDVEFVSLSALFGSPYYRIYAMALVQNRGIQGIKSPKWILGATQFTECKANFSGLRSR